VLNGKANARHDSSVEVGAGTLLGFETAEREVVIRDNGAGCIISVGRGGSEVGSCTNATIGGLVFGANIPIHITCDEIEGAKWVQSSELHLGNIIETFKPRRISDTSEGRDVEGRLDSEHF
jgi:hypothetical protein